jgi:hypothetical protein
LRQERLCGILVHDVKSRVHGAANLAVIMYQHSLTSFGRMFGLVPPKRMVSSLEFQHPEYGSEYALMGHPRSAPLRLTQLQLAHLRQFYFTRYSEFGSAHHADLVNMDKEVKLYYRCRVEKTIYHCKCYNRINSTRLNYLACIEEQVDRNAHVSVGVRPEEMVPERSYVYIDFFCLHTLRGQPHMLMYTSYRNTKVHDGLVQDLGHKHNGFQDIRILEHLCARVTCGKDEKNKKVYFVDPGEIMEERLRKALCQSSVRTA